MRAQKYENTMWPTTRWWHRSRAILRLRFLHGSCRFPWSVLYLCRQCRPNGLCSAFSDQRRCLRQILTMALEGAISRPCRPILLRPPSHACTPLAFDGWLVMRALARIVPSPFSAMKPWPPNLHAVVGTFKRVVGQNALMISQQRARYPLPPDAGLHPDATILCRFRSDQW